MSDKNKQGPVIALDPSGKLKYVGTRTDHDPILCCLIHLPDGEFLFYPAERCRAVSRAQALEIAVASTKYQDMSIRDLAISFCVADPDKLIEELENE